MMRQLIVNADDFGLTPGVNRGIITAFQKGIVTSTTLMVNMPGFEDAVKLAKDEPKLAVGIHLNLTYGAPLSPVAEIPSLIDASGRFLKDPPYLQKEADLPQIQAEFAAQIERFLSTGLKPSHLDTHHHLHREPRILDIVINLANKLAITVRPLDPFAMHDRGLVPKSRFVNYFGGTDGVQRLLTILHSLAEGVTEIPCHPGFCDPQLVSLSTLNWMRERELKALISPEITTTITQLSIDLTNYLEV